MSVVELLPFTAADAQAVVDGVRRPEWASGYPTAGDLTMGTRITEGVQAATGSANVWGPWTVSVDGTVVGGAGFHSAPDDAGTVEIGYGVAEEWRGRGVATTAVRAVLELARQHGAVLVVAGTDRDNRASQRVLEKTGFTMTGIDVDELRWRIDLTSRETL